MTDSDTMSSHESLAGDDERMWHRILVAGDSLPFINRPPRLLWQYALYALGTSWACVLAAFIFPESTMLPCLVFTAVTISVLLNDAARTCAREVPVVPAVFLERTLPYWPSYLQCMTTLHIAEVALYSGVSRWSALRWHLFNVFCFSDVIYFVGNGRILFVLVAATMVSVQLCTSMATFPEADRLTCAEWVLFTVNFYLLLFPLMYPNPQSDAAMKSVSDATSQRLARELSRFLDNAQEVMRYINSVWSVAITISLALEGLIIILVLYVQNDVFGLFPVLIAFAFHASKPIVKETIRVYCSPLYDLVLWCLEAADKMFAAADLRSAHFVFSLTNYLDCEHASESVVNVLSRPGSITNKYVALRTLFIISGRNEIYPALTSQRAQDALVRETRAWVARLHAWSPEGRVAASDPTWSAPALTLMKYRRSARCALAQLSSDTEFVTHLTDVVVAHGKPLTAAATDSCRQKCVYFLAVLLADWRQAGMVSEDTVGRTTARLVSVVFKTTRTSALMTVTLMRYLQAVFSSLPARSDFFETHLGCRAQCFVQLDVPFNHVALLTLVAVDICSTYLVLDLVLSLLEAYEAFLQAIGPALMQYLPGSLVAQNTERLARTVIRASSLGRQGNRVAAKGLALLSLLSAMDPQNVRPLTQSEGFRALLFGSLIYHPDPGTQSRAVELLQLIESYHSDPSHKRAGLSDVEMNDAISVVEDTVTDDTCCICLAGLDCLPPVGRLRCRHAFHVSCVKLWFYNHEACPTCRTPALPTPSHDTEGEPAGLLARATSDDLST
ncbi:hypothetical protein DIPPA_16112 [Diplonema papillatum]|nr:hypothetical protein DIPPA_16112 [Diplonema papillatum]